MDSSEFDEELVDIEELDSSSLDIRNYFEDPSGENSVVDRNYLLDNTNHPLSEFPEFSSWDYTAWIIDNTTGTTSESKYLADKMIKEERKYLDKKKVRQSKNSESIKIRDINTLSKKMKGRRQTLNSHNKLCPNQPVKKHWSLEERKLLDEGLKRYGKCWTKVAKMVGSRTATQVKNYCKYYLKRKTKETYPKAERKATIVSDPRESDEEIDIEDYSGINSTSSKDVYEKLLEAAGISSDVSIESEDANEQSPPEKPQTDVGDNKLKSEITDQIFDNQSDSKSEVKSLITDITNSEDLEQSACVVNIRVCSESRLKDYPATEILDGESSSPHELESDNIETPISDFDNDRNRILDKVDTTDDIDCEEAQGIDQSLKYFGDDNNSVNQDLELQDLDDFVIERNCIQEVEKIVNREFFLGRSSKTPERYQKIRNYILDAWDKCQPSYLNKTSLRVGLRNCGDVNAIGRVHCFLEQIGAINVGIEARRRNNIRSGCQLVNLEDKDVKTVENSDSLASFDINRLRKRSAGKCVNNDQHSVMPDYEISKDSSEAETEGGARIKSRRSTSYQSYNPFNLIPCRKFDSGSEPFQVSISIDALLVMEVHSHLCGTEVIGLLGGRYSCEQKELKILRAEPCESLSTEVQCEMDSVSQTEAFTELCNRGYSVVGWYHSHPYFSPIPSIRDIETQSKYQDWFAQGGAPFVGVIISPYYRQLVTHESSITCLMIGDKMDKTDNLKIPYQFNLPMNDFEENDYVQIIEDLIVKYKDNRCVIDLLQRSCKNENELILDKMISSLRSKMSCIDDQRRENILSGIRMIFDCGASMETKEN